MIAINVLGAKGNINMVKHLVEKGAEINIQDEDGETALHVSL